MRSTPVAPLPSSPGSGQRFVLGALLVAAIVLAYLAAMRGDFLWDDEQHVTINPVIIGPQGMKEIWTTPEANYFPLVLTNFWVQHALWGLNPVGYHIVTLICHVLAALLLWRLLERLSVPGAWLGAALWALHPVQVESVAWICELKNTQSAIFFLAAIWFWAGWLGVGRAANQRAEGDAAKRGAGSGRLYALTLGCAICALLSKPSTVMLPVVLGLLAWWRCARIERRHIVALVPFFALSALASGWTIWEQRHHSGALGDEWNQTVVERFLIAGRVIWFYLGKLAWPNPLVFIYPRWEINAGSPLAYLPIVAALGVLGLLWWKREGKLKPVLIAAVFFGALLFPVLGFFNVYFFRYSYVGDHFQYLASMGPLVLAGAGLAMLGGRLTQAAAAVKPVVAGVLVVGLGALTWRESFTYRNNEALWKATLKHNPAAFMAWCNLAETLVEGKRYAEAVDCFHHALALRPENARVHNDLGCAFTMLGEPTNAVGELERALQLQPDFAAAENNLGNALRDAGRSEEAAAHYRAAVKLKPDYATAYNNLGCELSTQGRFDDAIASFKEAIRLTPEDAASHSNLANALRNQGRLAEATAEVKEALRLKPDYAEAHSGYGMILEASGRPEEAMKELAEAVRLQPSFVKLRHDYGVALMRAGRGADGIVQFQEVVKLQPQVGANQALLGGALAQAGRWDEAIEQFRAGLRSAPNDADLHCNLAVALASTGKLPESVGEFQQALKLRPDFIEAHANFGAVLRSLGRNMEAFDHLDEAERLKQQAMRRR